MFRRISALTAAVLFAGIVNPTDATSQVRAVASQATPVASAAFMKLGEIKGTSADAQHKEWIEIQSFSWGTSNSGRVAATVAAASPTSPGTLTITKILDKSTPLLAQRCSGNQSVPEVTVHLPSPQKGQAMMEYVMKDVIISSCNQANGQESLSFNYAKIEMKYASAAPAATR
jgi:type VI secretion system Hcp family effector